MTETLQITDIPVAGYERVVRGIDSSCGLHAIIAVHDTTLGPALGGLRMWPYASEDEALFDVKRLSRGLNMWRWLTIRCCPGWQGSLFMGTLRGQALLRLTLDGDRVTGEERLLADLGERFRDVRQGPDGWLYVLTDSRNGRILRLER